ncbi:hypothetical protein D3C75_1035540 [compost metagenome]
MPPEIAFYQVGDGFGIRVLDGGLAPPRAHVQRLALCPGKGAEALVDPCKEAPFVLVRHEPAEELLVLCRAQLARQFLHEVGERVVLPERMIRVAGDVGDQCPVQPTLFMDIVTANHFLDHPGRAIGKKGLECLELVKFIPWQNFQATRPVDQVLQLLRNQLLDSLFY